MSRTNLKQPIEKIKITNTTGNHFTTLVRLVRFAYVNSGHFDKFRHFFQAWIFITNIQTVCVSGSLSCFSAYVQAFGLNTYHIRDMARVQRYMHLWFFLGRE